MEHSGLEKKIDNKLDSLAKVKVNLPKLQLPLFDGKIQECKSSGIFFSPLFMNRVCLMFLSLHI